MLIYQKRERLLMRLTDVPLRFPNVGEIKFTLVPGGTFGVGNLPDRLSRLGAEYAGQPVPNTGRIIHQVPHQLELISVHLIREDASVRIEGNIVSVKRTFESEDELLDLIESVNFGLPVAMSLQFVDAPVVAAVTGNLGGVE